MEHSLRFVAANTLDESHSALISNFSDEMLFPIVNTLFDGSEFIKHGIQDADYGLGGLKVPGLAGFLKLTCP